MKERICRFLFYRAFYKSSTDEERQNFTIPECCCDAQTGAMSQLQVDIVILAVGAAALNVFSRGSAPDEFRKANACYGSSVDITTIHGRDAPTVRGSPGTVVEVDYYHAAKLLVLDDDMRHHLGSCRRAVIVDAAVVRLHPVARLAKRKHVQHELCWRHRAIQLVMQFTSQPNHSLKKTSPLSSTTIKVGSREVFNVNLPNGFHAIFFIVQDLYSYIFDAVLRQNGGGSTCLGPASINRSK